jgi:hypothetical protein
MSMVMVRGFVPHKDFGEIPYVSFIYHIELVDGKVRFLVWNPVNEYWEIVSGDAARPVAKPTQDVPFNQRMREYHDWLRERKTKNG